MSGEKLSPLQEQFVRAYVRLGGLNATQAAIAAGYSGAGKVKGAGAAVSASRLLRLPQVLAAIRAETERTLRAGVAQGAQVLLDLATNGKSESVRLQAAQALLDRGGMQLASLSEHHVIVEDKRTDDELRKRIEELGLNARVIPGEVITTPLPTLSNSRIQPSRVANQGCKGDHADDSS